MVLQPSAEQPHATGAPETFGQPRAVDSRARFQIPFIPAKFFADRRPEHQVSGIGDSAIKTTGE